MADGGAGVGRCLTIKGYGEMSTETALDIAAMIDVHDRPGQSLRLRAELQREITTALATTQQKALESSRTAAMVLNKLGIRPRSPWITSDAGGNASTATDTL